MNSHRKTNLSSPAREHIRTSAYPLPKCVDEKPQATLQLMQSLLLQVEYSIFLWLNGFPPTLPAASFRFRWTFTSRTRHVAPLHCLLTKWLQQATTVSELLTAKKSSKKSDYEPASCYFTRVAARQCAHALHRLFSPRHLMRSSFNALPLSIHKCRNMGARWRDFNRTKRFYYKLIRKW